MHPEVPGGVAHPPQRARRFCGAARLLATAPQKRGRLGESQKMGRFPGHD